MKKNSTRPQSPKRAAARSKGPITIGLDLGDRTSRYCAVGDNGERMSEGSVATTRKAMAQKFSGMGRCRIAMEVGTHSPWLSRLLSKLGFEVIVANARQVQLISASSRKNDRLDARLLARLARVDPQLLRPIRHRSERAQADLMTIRDHKSDIEGLNVTICGDVRHSRVARSDIDGLAALGAGEIRICGPAALLPERSEFPGCRIIDDFDAALANCDVVIMLRLQKERMQSALGLAEADYFAAYGLTEARLAKARKDALVMHPGPMNRGIEIADAVADGPQSVILEQVANGIFVRMAVLAELLGDR